MKTQTPQEQLIDNTKSHHKEKIDVRVPAGLKKILVEEALTRGMHLSEYSSMLITSAHQHGAQQSAQLSIALQENEMLRQEIQKLKQQLANEDPLEKEYLAKLRMNKEILLKFLSSGSASKAQLKAVGFDPATFSGMIKLDGKNCTTILDLAYCINANNITIYKL